MLRLWSDQSEFMFHCTIFNLQIGPDFIFESSSQYLIFNSHFPVTTLGLVLFSGTCLNKFTVSVVPSGRTD